MYRCKDCKETGERPVPVYGETGIDSQRCEYCGSENITMARMNCDICGKTLFKGDRAFETRNDHIICKECVTEVMI